jgi:hypothetical protein
MVYDEHDQVGDVGPTVESIEWFAPDRPVSGTIRVVDGDGDASDVDR